MRQFTAVVNPTAGGSAGPAKLIPVARLLREAGAQVEVEYSQGLEHARTLARRAADSGQVVLGVGGDGTVGCVGGALAGTGAVLGIVPAGRGNDFARQIGLPGGPAELADLLLHGEARPVDVIEVESAAHVRQAVLSTLYAGLDTVANVYANRSRLLRGTATYQVGGVRAILGWRPVRYRITIDDQVRELRGTTVVVANSGFYGSGLRIAPGARVDDGLLDVVIVHAASKPQLFKLMSELKDGSHVRRAQVEVVRGREVTIEADRSLPWGADGEVDGELPVTARVLPGALKVICPPLG